MVEGDDIILETEEEDSGNPKAQNEKADTDHQSGHAESVADDDDSTTPVEEIQTETALEIEKNIIRDEQLERLYDTTGISHVLQKFQPKEKERLWHHVYPIDRFFLEAYADPIFVPVQGKAASESEIDDLYEFTPLASDRFPDQLGIKACGLKFKYKTTKPEGLRERAKYFPILRAFFRHLQPIPYKNLQPKKRESSDRMMVVPKDNEKRGAIVISSEPTPATGNKRINSFYPDIYRTLRGLSHTQETYLGSITEKDTKNRSDMEVVLLLQKSTEEMIGVLKMWHRLNDEQKVLVSEAITEAEEFLTGDLDKAKVEIREHFGKSKDFKDSLERINISAILARFQAVKRRLARLYKKFVNINKAVEEDKTELQTIRLAVERVFNTAHREIDTLLLSQYCKKFDDITAANTFIKTSARRVNKDLTEMMSSIKKVREHPTMPAPFPQWAEAFRTNVAVAYLLNQQIVAMNGQVVKPELLKKVHTKVCEYLIKAELVLRYQKIQAKFVDLIEQILRNPYSINPEKIYEDVNELRNLLDPPSIGKSYKYRDDIIFNDPAFTGMSRYLTHIESKTLEWERERQRIIKNIDNLTGLDAPKKVGQLEFGVVEELTNKLLELDSKYLDYIKELFDECDFEPAMKAHTFDAKKRSEEIIEEIGLQG